MKKYDLAIVGGSFSGLACANSASARGLSTVVFDKKSAPESSTQSTGIFVKEIADQIDLPSRLTRKIHGVRLYSPSLNYIDLVSPGYYFLATDTCEVLKWLALQAQDSGCELRFGQNVIQAYIRDSQIVLPNQQTACSYLIGADGARSRVAKLFGLGQNNDILLGIEYEVEGITNLDRDFLHVFLDSELAPGYIAWVVPGVLYSQVGLASKYPRKPNIKKFYNIVEKKFGGKNTRIRSRRGGFIPCGGTVRPFSRNNVCLLGDAAGMVSPMTAGGIHPAIEVGRLLGIAVSDHLQDRGFPPEHEIAKHIPSYVVKRGLRKFFDFLTPPNLLFNFLINNALFRKTAQLIFFHHRGLLSKKAWNEILGRENETKF
jgi:flavin-dependent dehydrogenase